MKTIIGLGHKARQGKDYLSDLIKENYPNVHIVHWADALYEEVRNNKREKPLIKLIGDVYWFGINPVWEGGVFDFQLPLLNKIFSDRNITEYWGMNEKDSEMLQFWGTDFRRKYFGYDYWVNKGLEKINSIQDGVILIPDTRFKNEVEAIKKLGGVYIDVQRYNEDGTRYTAKDRDPQHPSEIDLDGYLADYTVTANSGELDKLKEYALEIINRFIKEPTTQEC